MENRNRRLSLLYIAALILVFFAGFQIKGFLDQNDSDPVFNVYDEITATLDRYYLYELNTEAKQKAFLGQLEGIVQAYAESNQDPYTRLTSQSVYQPSSDQEKYVGLGVTVHFFEGALHVLDVRYASPSFGVLYPGDKIIGVIKNETNIYFSETDTLDSSSSHLKGEEGSIIHLLVEDPLGDERQESLTMTEILTPTAWGEALDGHIGYIKINTFSSYIENETEGTAKIFNDALRALEESTLTNENAVLILDLRDNPGGALSALHNEGTNLIPGIAQQLILNDLAHPLFTMANRNGLERKFYGGLAQAKPYQIKILVNEKSASAAEVLAAALATNGNYPLYGTPTFGKDVYQTTRRLFTLNELQYFLTYTEGYWRYGNNLSVQTTPLTIETIHQSGFYALELVPFVKEVHLDEVEASLASYQTFLNVYYETTGANILRADGYLDIQTSQALTQFQTDNQLIETGTLTLETAQKMYLIMKSKQEDLTVDTQLQTLLAWIDNENNSGN